MTKLYVVGIGPGGLEHMTQRAIACLKESDIVVGYKPYLEYISYLIEGKQTYSSGMGGELERCQKAIDFARAGKTVSIISTGDAGLYGMAGPILELSKGLDLDIEVIPGVSSAFSAAAELGAALMHDTALISLSDLLTPWDLIVKRLELAAQADFVIALYNPRSKKRQKHLPQALDIMIKYKPNSTPVGIVKNSGRNGKEITITTLDKVDVEQVDMFTILIIGNQSSYIEGDKIITPRGYDL